MSNISERPVLIDEHQIASARPAFDWENARVFLEISRKKSFRAAGTALNLSVNAVRHRLGMLERQLGVTLFTRHVDGVRLTAEGERVAAVVERMESEAYTLLRTTDPVDAAMHGTVRLAITEGLGALWVGPRLADFFQDNPKITVDLLCAMEPADVLRLEADVAVQLVPPQQKDLRVVRLGRLHAMPFAAPSYVAAHGLPQTIADIAQHQLALQVAEQVTRPETFAQRHVDARLGRISFQTNASIAHYWSVVRGVGIGMLPTYVYLAARAAGAELTPIDVGYRTEHDIWLVYHADAGRIPRVRRLMDWLIDAFSPRRCPWFADAFVHPNALPDRPLEAPVAYLGEGRPR